MKLYSEKKQTYFQNIRHDIISVIPEKSSNKILEIGAGGGDTLIELKRRKIASEVTGIELMQLKDSNQKNSNIDHFIFGDIETMEFNLQKNHFDIIIIGDVLEHLIDPWNTLKKIYPFLKDGGLLITSIPNIREILTLYSIVIKGDFKYQESGILDKTHLRFFCKKNMISLLKNCSLEPIEIYSGLDISKVSYKMKLANKLTLGLLKEFFTAQYIIVSKKGFA